MPIIDNLRSIEFDRNKKHLFGIKSAILWGYSKDSNSCYPILYISKPRGISQEDFEYLIDRLEIQLKK